MRIGRRDVLCVSMNSCVDSDYKRVTKYFLPARVRSSATRFFSPFSSPFHIDLPNSLLLHVHHHFIHGSAALHRGAGRNRAVLVLFVVRQIFKHDELPGDELVQLAPD